MIGRRLPVSRTLQIKFSRLVNIELGDKGGGRGASRNPADHKSSLAKPFCNCAEGPAMFPSSVAEQRFFDLFFCFSSPMRSHPTNAAGFTLQGTSRRPHLPPRLLSTSRHSHHLHGRQISTFCILVCGIPLTLPWASNHRKSASTSVSLLQSSRLALKYPTMCFSLQVFLLANVTSNNKLRSAGFGRRYVTFQHQRFF